MESETIRIILNGAERAVSAGQSVAALLTSMKIDSERVAVELNKSIVRKRDWDRTVVLNGSQVEIVEFVGGG